MTSFPRPLPRDSEQFYPPAFGKFKEGTEAAQLQNTGREQTVCAIALDIHYELNVSANEPGGGSGRGKPFNPRMSSPACPHNYTGKRADPSVYLKLDDPIVTNKKIHESQPYDPQLYAIKDPRLCSKTVVIRDYGCKIPIDMTDTEKLAKAVLTSYPDQYVAFLGEFVSNMFGDNMRMHLTKQITGYKKLLHDSKELNRVSWGAYIGVQGGVDHQAEAASAELKAEVDRTLNFSSHAFNELSKLSRDGSAMSAQVSAADYYNLKPCIEQHIATLEMMKTKFCKGFASTEHSVLAMLWYINDQGRNLCDDLKLMKEEEEPSYSCVTLQVPHSLLTVSDGKMAAMRLDNPEDDTSIRKDLDCSMKSYNHTPSYAYSMGKWTGNTETDLTFLGSGNQGPYSWGWGHCANVICNMNDSTTAFVPYHMYTVPPAGGKMSYTYEKASKTFIDAEKFGAAFRDGGAADARAITKNNDEPVRSLRDSLVSEEAVYGKMRDFDEAPYTTPAGVGMIHKPRPGMIMSKRQPSCPRGVPISTNRSCASVDPYPMCYEHRNGKLSLNMFGPLRLEPQHQLTLHLLERFPVSDTTLRKSFVNAINNPSPGMIAELGVDPSRFPGDSVKEIFEITKAALTTAILTEEDMLETIDAMRNEFYRARPMHKRHRLTHLAGGWSRRTLLSKSTHVNMYSAETLDKMTEPAIFRPFFRPSEDPRDLHNTFDASVTVNKPETNFSFDCISSRLDRAKLKILALRKMFAEMLGMDCAAVMCHNPFLTWNHWFVDGNHMGCYSDGLIELGRMRKMNSPDGVAQVVQQMNNVWDDAVTGKKSQYTFTVGGPDGRSIHLINSQGGELGEEERDTVYLDGVADIIMKRFQIMQNGTRGDRLALTSSLLIAIAEKYSTNMDEVGDIMSMPSELYVQSAATDYDPTLLYTNDLQDYARQAKQRPSLNPNTGRELRLWNWTGEMNVNIVRDSDSWCDYICKTFKEKLDSAPALVVLTDRLMKPPVYKGSYRSTSYSYSSLEEEEEEHFHPSAWTRCNVLVDSKEETYNIDTLTCTPTVERSEFLTRLSKGELSSTEKLSYQRLKFSEKETHDGAVESAYNDLKYNFAPCRPQAFAMFDAAALLWNARSFINPADGPRPEENEGSQPDDMHYWSRTFVESFLVARQNFERDYGARTDRIYEFEVKKHPNVHFPTRLIGALAKESFERYFPLLPADHTIRDDLRRMRALNVMWGTLPSTVQSQEGAWMPLSVSHQVRLQKSVDIFDMDYRVPANPWCAHGEKGCSKSYSQSYHSVFYNESYKAAHFKEWIANACRYQRPQSGKCFYPFTQYGGTPVEADFTHHRVEKPSVGFEEAHRRLMYNRFGLTTPLRLGNSSTFRDTGILQDMYQFEYRAFAKLSPEQRTMPPAPAVHPTNFLAYARTHAIVALASGDGVSDKSDSLQHRIVKNLYRVYVDTYKCMGLNPDDDGVPAVLGFTPKIIQNPKEDRSIIFYAGSLPCINAKLETFCRKDTKRACLPYKQMYLNEATLLHMSLLERERRRELHDLNFEHTRMRRGPSFTRAEFDRELIDLLDLAYKSLQTSFLSYLIETGAAPFLKTLPLHMLESRELQVSFNEEDDSILPSDYMTPLTRELIKNMDFSSDSLSRRELAILQLVPPHHRILGTLKFNHSSEIVDLTHVKAQIQRDTMDKNKEVWQKYAEHLVGSAFAKGILEVDGPVDFSFDMSSIKDPLMQAEGIQNKMYTRDNQSSSRMSTQITNAKRISRNEPLSVLPLEQQTLDIIEKRLRKQIKGGKSPQEIQKILNKAYKNGTVPKSIQTYINDRLLAADGDIFAGTSSTSMEREDVYGAVERDGMQLRHAAEHANDPEVVLAAVSQNGLALAYASDSLRDDKQTVLAAVEENRNAVQYASETMQNDIDVRNIVDDDDDE